MNGLVGAFAAFDGGDGPALHAGGAFTSAADSGDGFLAKWGCPAPCPADVAPLGGDGTVYYADMLVVLASWGPCLGCAPDVDGDGVVDLADLVAVLGAWGPCP